MIYIILQEESRHCQESEYAGDPGILIYFADPTLVHNCLGLASVATVAGAWGARPWHLTSPMQGKKEKI